MISMTVLMSELSCYQLSICLQDIYVAERLVYK